MKKKPADVITHQELRQMVVLYDQLDTLREQLEEKENRLLARVAAGAVIEPDAQEFASDNEIVITETITGSGRVKKLRVQQRGD